jgi:hypothetical protein
MRDDHSQADNLFSRLISYTPRIGEGGRRRTALEDYYTEALAWCLRSPDFREVFLNLIKEASPEASQALPSGVSANLDVHTQLGFAQAEEEDSDEPGKRRRFDLVIQSPTDPSLVIVVENKISWQFTKGQLPAYKRELEEGDRFKHFEMKLLIVLSPSGENPGSSKALPVIGLRWSEVQRRMAEFAGVAHGCRHEQMDIPVIQFVCAQFAEFLKEKGLAPMKIAPSDSAQVTSWISGFEAQESMTRILNAVRANRAAFRRKAPFFETGSGGDDDGSRWFGVYGTQPKGLYLGFRLRDQDGKTELHLWIEMSSPGKKRLKTELMDRLRASGGEVVEENQTGTLNISRKVTGTPMDGNAEQMRGWFESCVRAIEEFMPGQT